MARYTIDLVQPALDFVNSQHGRGPDLLEDAGWFEGFLLHWGYAGAGRPDDGERKRLVALRALMRRVVEIVAAGGSPSAADRRELNRVLGRVQLSRELASAGAGFELRLVPGRQDWGWVRAELAASLAELLAGGERERLKVCDDHECRFAFYDVSKNRSRRWCAQTTCGNRHKVRRFRARRRALAGDGRGAR